MESIQIKQKLLIYSFWAFNNISFKALRNEKFNNYKKIYIQGLKSIQKLCRHVELNNYELIIGIGDYSRHSKNILIETCFVNNFRNKKIFINYPSIFENIQNIKGVKVNNITTNGFCNLSAFLILLTLKKMHRNTKFAFLHIPKNLQIDYVEHLLETLLNKLT